MVDIPEDDEKFIVKHVADGYQADEIAYLLKSEEGSHVSKGTVERFVETDYAKDRVDMHKRIKERKAKVSREELVSDLKEVKDSLIERSEQLREQELDEVNNDKISNLISNIKLLGEFIGELKQKDDSSTGVVNVNKLEQNFNFTQAIQYMPAEDKKDVAEQLADDPEVEDFVIVKNDE